MTNPGPHGIMVIQKGKDTQTMATKSKTTGMTRNTKTQPCGVCGRACKPEYGTELCSECYEDAGFENEHVDGYHEASQGGPNPACPLCNPKEKTVKTINHYTSAPILSKTGCGCGCGQTPKGKKSRFLPGHDAKAHSINMNAEKAKADRAAEAKAQKAAERAIARTVARVAKQDLEIQKTARKTARSLKVVK